MALINTLHCLHQLLHLILIHHQHQKVRVTQHSQLVLACSLEYAGIAGIIDSVIFAVVFVDVDFFVHFGEGHVVALVIDPLDIQSFMYAIITPRERQYQILLLCVVQVKAIIGAGNQELVKEDLALVFSHGLRFQIVDERFPVLRDLLEHLSE
jgi:hypothetical protein